MLKKKRRKVIYGKKVDLSMLIGIFHWQFFIFFNIGLNTE